MLDKELRSILKNIEKKTGFDASQYRYSTLLRRLNLRLAATRSKNYKEYLASLKNDPSEYQRFIQTLTINVTEFFRDKDVFQNFKKHFLPGLIQKADKRKNKSLRIWSVGCSRGQEPYSLAMLIFDVLGKDVQDYRIIIHATDVDPEALEKANNGKYTLKEVKSVPKITLKKYFQPMNSMYEIRPEIKKMIRFSQLDLIKGNPPGKFDLVVCRNVFIFFETQLQKKMLQKLYSSLKRDGLLLLGKSEMLHQDNLFTCISTRYHIYQKNQTEMTGRITRADMKGKK